MDNGRMIVVSDSSPLISLAVIEKLNMLEKLYMEIFVPTAVFFRLSRLLCYIHRNTAGWFDSIPKKRVKNGWSANVKTVQNKN